MVQLAANGYGRSVVARGFFEVFYQWSRVGCSGAGSAQRRNLISPVHSKTRLQQLPRWQPISSRIQARHESTTSQEAAAVPIAELESNKTTDEKPEAEKPEAPSPPPEPPLSTALRRTMRSLPHPVVLLTTAKRPPLISRPPRPAWYRAMTLSSLTTISLSPDPIISFNIRLPSKTHETILHNRNFFIHILAATPAGARLADLFTRGNGGEEAFRGILETAGKVEGDGEGDGKGEEKGEGIKVIEHEIASPTINGNKQGRIVLPRIEADGVVKVLRCQLRKTQAVGDHALVLGEVVEVLGETEAEVEGEEGVSGLGYNGGKYRGVGEVIDLESGKDV